MDTMMHDKLSRFDGLTGLCSRNGFFEQATELLMVRQQQQYIIVCSNIVHFKRINELYGISGGDQVLRTLGQAIRQWQNHLREPAAFGRIHSDLFVGCLPMDKWCIDSYVAMCRKALAALKFNTEVSFTFGVYKVTRSSLTVEEMTDRAIIALQAVEKRNEGPYAIYDRALRDEVLREKALTMSLQASLEQGHIQVYYQPMYEFMTHRIIRAEALVRWFHPEMGCIAPNEFIPLFEKTGMVTVLDRYVWETVCRYQRRCLDEERTVIPISVNVSRVDFYQNDAVDFFRRLLEKYDLAADLIELEVTESAYMDNPWYMRQVLTQLKDLGFKILMDDFGSGYSSLNMLMNLPVDTLKVDMMFIRQLDESQRAADIVGSIVRMAQWLKINTVMEGVETKNQNEYLKHIGCNEGQGYYFSRPVSEFEFQQFVENHTEAMAETVVSDDFNMKCYRALTAFGEDKNALFDLLEGMGVYELRDHSLSLLWANESYGKIWGRQTLPLDDKGWNPIHPADKQLVKEALQRAATRRKPVEVTYRSRRQDGRSMVMHARIHYLGKRNQAATYFMTFFDLTSYMAKECETRA